MFRKTKKFTTMLLCCAFIIAALTACSGDRGSSSNPPVNPSSSHIVESTSANEAEKPLSSSMDEGLNESDESKQQTAEKILLHVIGEEEGSGAVMLEADSIQEMVDYLHDLQPSDFQGELQESYTLQVNIFIGDTIEEYEITAEGLVNGKVLARKVDSPNNTNDSLSSNAQYKWFLVDANIWNTIDPYIYLPFFYKNGELISRPSDR